MAKDRKRQGSSARTSIEELLREMEPDELDQHYMRKGWRRLGKDGFVESTLANVQLNHPRPKNTSWEDHLGDLAEGDCDFLSWEIGFLMGALSSAGLAVDQYLLLACPRRHGPAPYRVMLKTRLAPGRPVAMPTKERGRGAKLGPRSDSEAVECAGRLDELARYAIHAGRCIRRALKLKGDGSREHYGTAVFATETEFSILVLDQVVSEIRILLHALASCASRV